MTHKIGRAPGRAASRTTSAAKLQSSLVQLDGALQDLEALLVTDSARQERSTNYQGKSVEDLTMELSRERSIRTEVTASLNRAIGMLEKICHV